MSDETAKELKRAGVVSDDEARQILSRFNSSHWKNQTERARYSIPADPKRDDDIRLDAYIAQTRELRAERDRLREQLRVAVEALEQARDIRANDGIFAPSQMVDRCENLADRALEAIKATP